MASNRWLKWTVFPAALLVGALAAPVAGAPDPVTGVHDPGTGAQDGERRARFARVHPSAALPDDLASPEGKSRWDLRSFAAGDRFVRTIEPGAASVIVQDGSLALGDTSAGDHPRPALAYTDPDGGDAALRFLMPDRAGEGLRPGLRWHGDLLETGRDDAPPDRLRLDSEIVGIGWVELPSGPREVVLERLLVLRERGGRGGFVPDRLAHRFIDPRAGVVAEISGPSSPDGRGRTATTEAFVLEAILAGAADLRLYVSDLWDVPLADISYGWDRGAGTTVASLTPAPGFTTIGDLLAQSSWDFSGNTSGVESAATTTLINSQETCNTASCGYNTPGAQLDRTDKNFTDLANVDKINAVMQREDRTADTTLWLRAGAQHEGKTGTFGSGESRFCYTGTYVVGTQTLTRTPAPLWVLAHQDAPGAERYLLPGDSWTSPPFNCEQNIFNQLCGVAQTFDKLYSKACGTHTGTQSGRAIKNGVVTLPSGHTFNAMVASTIADFCVFLTSGCSSFFMVDEVRTVNYLWQVPKVGTVVRIQSGQNETDATSWTKVGETDIKFGLFPPLSITATAVSDTSVDLSWNPGRDTHRISGYKIYWGTDSGAAAPYAFDSTRSPGQVTFAGTTATISGLTPGTTYYFTVTSLSDFRDPSSLVTTTYESILYPTQISGDPAFVYPVEVQARTTGGPCLPTTEVTALTVSHAPGGIQICWNPVSDSCLTGYEILGAAAPQAAANFAPIADTDLSTCWTGDPAASYFLVVARGSGGTGPWGAYGR